MFLSADTVQGNGSGENPYSYVGGNPETYNDPSGHCPACAIGIGVGLVVASEVFVPLVVGGVLAGALGIMIWQATHQSTGTTVSSSSTTTANTPSSSDLTAYWNAVQAYWLARLASHPLTPPHQTPPITTTSAGNLGGITTAPSTLEPSDATGIGGGQRPPNNNHPPTALQPEEPAPENQGIPVNRSGDPYPRVIDPRTGEPIPFPEGELQWLPEEDRVTWDQSDRISFIQDWVARGYAEPEGGWGMYDIHHILPKEYGGTNDFENLVPVLRRIHRGRLPDGLTA